MYTFSQGQVFIIFLIVGLIIGIIFDFFRAVRKVFKTSDFVTYIEDIIFMAIIGILIVNNLILVNNGEIRFFIILAILFGTTLYFMTISRICLKMFQILVSVIKKILFFPLFFKKLFKKRKDFEE